MEKLSAKIIWRELSYFFFGLYLVLVFLEIISPNMVLAYFNLNYLLVLIVLSSLVSIIKK